MAHFFPYQTHGVYMCVYIALFFYLSFMCIIINCYYAIVLSVEWREISV